MKGFLLSVCLGTLVLAVYGVAGTTNTSSNPPPVLYAFSFSADKNPGYGYHAHSEGSDGCGIVRGKYSYVDPRNETRTVKYVADSGDFHASDEQTPESEALAYNRERYMCPAIADDHANNPPVKEEASAVPRQSAVVAAAAERHHELFARIAQHRAQLAVERDRLMLAVEA